MIFRTAVASLLLVATACAAEDDYWLEEDLSFVDIRLGIGLVPKPDTYDVDVALIPVGAFPGGTIYWTDTVDSDRAKQLSYSIVGGTLAPLGMLFGGELVYTWDNQTFEGRTIDGVQQPLPGYTTSLQYHTFGGNFLTGAGLALTRNVHLELLGVIGLGALTAEFADGDMNDYNRGNGWYWNAGLRGGIYATWRRFVLGAAVEWTFMEYNADAVWLDADTNINDSVAGVGGRLEIGYHIP